MLHQVRKRMPISLSVVLTLTALLAVLAPCAVAGDPPAGPAKPAYRWDNHDFVFCFVTDDGTLCNLGWAQTGLEMDFRFTIAVNCGLPSAIHLDGEDMHGLHEQGFEIANHAYSHGLNGLPESCPKPPRGSLAGYFLCDVDPDTAAVYFAAEIERDSVAAYADIPTPDIRVLAYPRHRHLKVVIDGLIAEGYLGARCGGRYSYASDSYDDFQVQARNSWDAGISLYRVPLGASTVMLFGDHSAVPPVHYNYAQFLAAVTPLLEQARAAGGIFTFYTHHFGDDDDTYGNFNYGSGGLTPEELGWLVDIVRQYGGTVMTFGDAVAYYRARSAMVDIDGDKVWQLTLSGVSAPARPAVVLHPCVPNPFNPRTTISFELREALQLSIGLFDLSGRRVVELGSGTFSEGPHSLVWEGRDATGRAMSAGTYLLQLSAPGICEHQKLVLLK
jgi:hypothetical protein